MNNYCDVCSDKKTIDGFVNLIKLNPQDKDVDLTNLCEKHYNEIIDKSFPKKPKGIFTKDYWKNGFKSRETWNWIFFGMNTGLFLLLIYFHYANLDYNSLVKGIVLSCPSNQSIFSIENESLVNNCIPLIKGNKDMVIWK